MRISLIILLFVSFSFGPTEIRPFKLLNWIAQFEGKVLFNDPLTDETDVVGVDFSSTSLNDNQLREFVQKTPHISMLLLHNTNVTNKGLDSIRMCPELAVLTVPIGLNSQGARAIGHLKKSKRLSASFAELSRDGLLEIAKLQHLQSLELSNSRFANGEIQLLTHLADLEELNLSGTKIGDDNLDGLCGLQKLRSLDLYGTAVTDATIHQIAKVTRLKHLSLGCTKITDNGLRHLRPLLNLETLDLYGTDVSDSGVVNLGVLKSLVRLSLQCTDVTGSRFDSFTLPSVISLSLRCTKFLRNESLEKLASAFPKLETLDLVGSGIDEHGLRQACFAASLRSIEVSKTLLNCKIENFYELNYPDIELHFDPGS